jgi:hypothetical protein
MRESHSARASGTFSRARHRRPIARGIDEDFEPVVPTRGRRHVRVHYTHRAGHRRAENARATAVRAGQARALRSSPPHGDGTVDPLARPANPETCHLLSMPATTRNGPRRVIGRTASLAQPRKWTKYLIWWCRRAIHLHIVIAGRPLSPFGDRRISLLR